MHHVNIDRIWWEWQQGRSNGGDDAADRFSAYEGRAGNATEMAARLDDVLDVAGLAGGVQVADVLDIGGGQFCYGY